MHADEDYVCRRFDRAIHKAFRKVMGLIEAAANEIDLRAFKSLRLEKLAGDRAGESSLRLNKKMRLIVKFRTEVSGQKIIVIEIIDYHR